MCITPELQRNGIGKELYRELEIHLRKRHINSVYLITRHDIPAARFYRRMGFREDEVFRMYTAQVGKR